MDEFFDYIKKFNIQKLSDVSTVIFNLNLAKLIDFAINCHKLINTKSPFNQSEKKYFDFSVNNSISGGEKPCMEISCRLGRASKLANFAALYANTIFIPPPFDYIEHRDFNFENKTQIYLFYQRIAGDIALMLFYKPLIDEGIIKINSRHMALCKECFALAKKRERLLNRKINKIENKITKCIANKIKFKLDENQGLLITPQEYTGTEVLRFAILPKELKKYISNLPHIFNRREVKDLKLIEKTVLSQTLNDLFLQKYSLRTLGLNYLTNLGVEADIINSLDPKNITKNNDLKKNLIHELPIISGVGTKEIIKLRKNEAEAFNRYRDAVQKVVKETQTEKNGKIISEAVQDLITPEINKIKGIIKANRTFFLKKARNKFILDIAMISAGIFSNQIFGINFSDIFRDLGMIQPFAIKEIYDDVSAAVQTPLEIMNSDFYFIWKLKK